MTVKKAAGDECTTYAHAMKRQAPPSLCIASLAGATLLALGCSQKTAAPTPPSTNPLPSTKPQPMPVQNPTSNSSQPPTTPAANSGPNQIAVLSDAAAAKLAAASNAFGVELWKAQGAAAGNVAMSPASITAALAMTWGGAKGTTSAEMRKVLQLEGDVAAVFQAYGRLAASLQDPKRQQKLRIANRLFGEQSFTFEQPFIAQTTQAFAAPLQPMDFVGSAEAQRGAINQWVEAQTEHRIKDLLPPRSITDATRLVLVNAIYFLADWAQPFKAEQTFDAPFSLTARKQKNVPMMHQRGGFRLATGGGATVLELPYQGDDTAMWIVLPNTVNGLPAVEAQLSTALLATWSASFKNQEIVVTLPKFEINPPDSLALSQALKKLGINDAFDENKADFTGIGVPPEANRRLFISAVFHKAFVKVDENGTEAAAATAVVMMDGTGAPRPAPTFVADHPFLFMIVDKRSGLLLFIGRVDDPQ